LVFGGIGHEHERVASCFGIRWCVLVGGSDMANVNIQILDGDPFGCRQDVWQRPPLSDDASHVDKMAHEALCRMDKFLALKHEDMVFHIKYRAFAAELAKYMEKR
jgi:hypothetical protein